MMQANTAAAGNGEGKVGGTVVDLAEWRWRRVARGVAPLDERLRDVGRACQEMSHLSQRNSAALHGVADDMGKAMDLLTRAVNSGRRLVEDLDAVLVHAGRTSAFNAECRKAVELAEAIDGPERLAEMEAMRDSLALELKAIIRKS